MRWLSPNPRPYQTALAMIGAKPAQQILILGASDGQIAAAVAAVTGLNGRTLVIDSAAEARGAVERAAANAGALVEFDQAPWSNLPAEPGTFDIVVVQQQMRDAGAASAALLTQAVRALRPGGRVVVIEGVKASGWRERLRSSRDTAVPTEALCQLLSASGLRAARILAQTEGVTYLEGSKPR